MFWYCTNVLQVGSPSLWFNGICHVQQHYNFCCLLKSGALVIWEGGKGGHAEGLAARHLVGQAGPQRAAGGLRSLVGAHHLRRTGYGVLQPGPCRGGPCGIDAWGELCFGREVCVSKLKLPTGMPLIERFYIIAYHWNMNNIVRIFFVLLTNQCPKQCLGGQHSNGRRYQNHKNTVMNLSGGVSKRMQKIIK